MDFIKRCFIFAIFALGFSSAYGAILTREDGHTWTYEEVLPPEELQALVDLKKVFPDWSWEPESSYWEFISDSIHMNLPDIDKGFGDDDEQLLEYGSIDEIWFLFDIIAAGSGQIPESLGNLTNLSRLHLQDCGLSGPIPAAFENLVNLKTLDLWGNELSGEIPDFFGNLPKLTTLSLGSNNFTGSIPSTLGNSNTLISLSLFNNQLSGAIPSNLGNSSTLSSLSLHNNQLTGSIPPSLGNISTLTDLSLKNNQLTGSIPSSLGNLNNLITLNLGANQLSGSIPDSLGDLTNLENLYLDENQLTGSIPPSLGNLSNLIILNLGANQLSGLIPDSLGDLTNLWKLFLYENQLTGSLPSSLGNLGQLITFSLGENQFTGTIPGSFKNLKSVEFFTLRANQLSGQIPSFFGDLSNLYFIGLHNNNFTGEIPESLGSLSKLNELYLYGNELHGVVPESFANLAVLEMLNIRSNYISGELPEGLLDLKNLTGFYLSDNCLLVADGSPNHTLISQLIAADVEVEYTPQKASPDYVTIEQDQVKSYSPIQTLSLDFDITNNADVPIDSQIFYAFEDVDIFSYDDSVVRLNSGKTNSYKFNSVMVNQIESVKSGGLGHYKILVYFGGAKPTAVRFNVLQTTSVKVLDANTSEPIKGATVQLFQYQNKQMYSDMTGADGKPETYPEYAVLTDGLYWYEISAPGYVSQKTEAKDIGLHESFNLTVKLEPKDIDPEPEPEPNPDPDPTNPRPRPLREAEDFGGGFYLSEWFGGFFKSDAADTFLYTMDFGWAWVSPVGTADNMWWWSFNMESWMWGSADTGRYFYRNSDGKWVFVLSEKGGGSWIQDTTTDEWTFLAQ